MLLGIAAVAALNLDVDIVGHIDGGPACVRAPRPEPARLRDARLRRRRRDARRFAEGLGAAKTYAAREHYEIDTTRELFGLGGANLAAGRSSGMVSNGSLSMTAVNGGAGAHTQLSALVVAALTVVTLLVLTGLFEQLPEATLAAVVSELVDLRALRALYRDTTRGIKPRRRQAPSGQHLA